MIAKWSRSTIGSKAMKETMKGKRLRIVTGCAPAALVLAIAAFGMRVVFLTTSDFAAGLDDCYYAL
jgi:hypothetical protein